MRTATIGYYRSDGDLAILATLNNKDEHIAEDSFNKLVRNVFVELSTSLPDYGVQIFENREDAPDYIKL